MFCGSSKPNNDVEFLGDFKTEYMKLKTQGFQYEGKTYFVNVKAFVCDAPARQFLKGIKAHNSYFGCERCDVKVLGMEELCFIQSTAMKEVT